MRQWRKTSAMLRERKAEHRGAERMRVLILSRLEGDLAMLELNGLAAGEIVRAIRFD